MKNGIFAVLLAAALIGPQVALRADDTSAGGTTPAPAATPKHKGTHKHHKKMKKSTTSNTSAAPSAAPSGTPAAN